MQSAISLSPGWSCAMIRSSLIGRRIDRVLASLRTALERRGVTSERAAEIIAHHGFERLTATDDENPAVDVRLFAEPGRLPAHPTRPE